MKKLIYLKNRILIAKTTLVIISGLMSSGLLLTPSLASAQIISPTQKAQACQGVYVTSSACDSNAENSVNFTLTNFINIFSVIIGIIAVIMLLVGGFKYITSAGDPQAAESAKNTIIYALIGAVITVFAQVLVHFVLAKSASASAGG